MRNRSTARMVTTVAATGLLVAATGMASVLAAPAAAATDTGATALGPDGATAADLEPESADAPCEPLVTHSPSGSHGAVEAVAITSQALDAESDGWVRVAWEAAPGTSVSDVLLIRADGVEHLTDGDLRTGGAEQVLELAFCGDSAEQSTSAPAPSDDPPDATAEQGDGEVDPRERSTGSDPSRDEGADADHEVEVGGAQLTTREAPTEDDADTEVLGATLAHTGDGVGGLLAGGLAGLLAGTLALAGARRLQRETN